MNDWMYASFRRRFLAVLLDTLVLALPAAIAANLIPVLGGVLVWFLYFPVLEASEIRATLGKHLMGIQVVDLQGRRLSFRAALMRNFLKLASSVLLFVGHFFALFTERKQALHDSLADSLVVYGRSERSIPDAWGEAIRSLFGEVKGAEAARLSELERLQALREKGAITEEEFQAEKARILGRGKLRDE